MNIDEYIPRDNKNANRGKMRRLVSKQNGLCAYCDTPFSKKLMPTFDHIIPKAKGGRGTPNNLAAVCTPCNQLKGGFASFDEAFDYCHYQLEFFDNLRKRGFIR